MGLDLKGTYISQEKSVSYLHPFKDVAWTHYIGWKLREFLNNRNSYWFVVFETGPSFVSFNRNRSDVINVFITLKLQYCVPRMKEGNVYDWCELENWD